MTVFTSQESIPWKITLPAIIVLIGIWVGVTFFMYPKPIRLDPSFLGISLYWMATVLYYYLHYVGMIGIPIVIIGVVGWFIKGR